MTIFYQGTLQDGISLAVRETKAVVCFVRDDAQLSSTWEEGYFADDQIVPILNAKAVLLRLTAGSQEAGFLTSFCPISKFPTVVVIKNGMPQEYLVPDISKEDFRSRLIAVLEGQKPSGFTEQSQQSENSGMNDASADSSASASAAPIAQTQGQASDDSVHYPQPSQKKRTGDARGERRAIKAEPWKDPAPATAASSTLPKRQPVKETQKPSSNSKSKKEQTSQAPQRSTDSNAGKTTSRPDEHLEAQPPTSRAPPSQYRLQVRLFDGSSVRSSFTPSQTIRNDVRPWLDDQMTDDHRPYNLKHILTPLSSQTLSIAEESQTLEDLDLGSTATLVMVPVQNYTDAYAGAGSSLPVRGISAAYNLVSSAAGTATGLVTGLVGSIMGYGSTQTGEPGPSDSTSDPSSSADSSRRLRSAGPNIHTFRDQQDEHGNSQLYNGNQLNFEPWKNQDGKDN